MPCPTEPPGHLSPAREERIARLLGLEHPAEEVARKTAEIYQAVLNSSVHIRTGNFTAIDTRDLSILFRLYDRSFFDGLLGAMLREDLAEPIGLRLSGRLTRSAGTTTRRRRKWPTAGGLAVRTDYTITISTTLLFGTFREPGRAITVSGLFVRDRLEALQRIFEHELLHLAEHLGWGESSCAGATFQRLSRQIFAHQAVHHDLVTPREQAAVKHGIVVGDLVAFEHHGTRHVGRVNRIVKRATVLVEHPRGREYSDGKTYLAFYVPVALLRKAT